MCLGIPGRLVAVADAERLMMTADISGVRRAVNVACIAEAGLEPLIGCWTLIHVGFAMSLIDEAEAQRTLDILHELGEAQEALDAMAASEARPA